MATITTTDSLAFLLQMSDSAFPTGGYAHSYGLEEMARCGLVTNEASLLEFLQHQIRPSMEHLELPLLRDAHAVAVADDLDALLAVDALAGALKLPQELREASRRVGLRRLQTLLKLYPNNSLTALHEAVQRKEAHGHHITVFACACRTLPVEDTLTAYYYQTLAGFCSASLKILRIGQEGTQRVLSACLLDMAAVIASAMQVPSGEIGWFDPVMDLASMRHEIANERLFIS